MIEFKVMLVKNGVAEQVKECENVSEVRRTVGLEPFNDHDNIRIYTRACDRWYLFVKEGELCMYDMVFDDTKSIAINLAARLLVGLVTEMTCGDSGAICKFESWPNDSILVTVSDAESGCYLWREVYKDDGRGYAHERKAIKVACEMVNYMEILRV